MQRLWVACLVVASADPAEREGNVDAEAQRFLDSGARMVAHESQLLRALFRRHNCTHAYIDVGTNLGVQIRKVHQPKLYPPNGATPLERRHFGQHAARVAARVQRAFGSDRCRVCSIGFEPNPAHAARLKTLQQRLRAAGFGVLILFAAASSADGFLALEDSAAAASNNHWGARTSVFQGAVDGDASGAPPLVRTLDLARILHSIDALLRSQAGGWARRGRVVMKMDIEGKECAGTLSAYVAMKTSTHKRHMTRTGVNWDYSV